MTDDWTPENLPIMLMNKSLLTATKDSAYEIGKARLTAGDEQSMIALDKLFNDGYEQHDFKNRYDVSEGLLDDIIDIPYQVTYYFPSKPRNNKVSSGTYGSKGLTGRVLYDALSDGYNGGTPFIDMYFLSCFKDRMLPKYKEAIRVLKQKIADEAQNKRQQHRAYLRNYEVWASADIKSVFKDLAKETKLDIIKCLSTGQVPLNKRGLSDKTLAARARLGIPSTAVFFATGRLIKSIVVSVILLHNETAAKEGISNEK